MLFAVLSVGCWTLSSAAEPPALAQARRALTEEIPQVAIAIIQSALNNPGFPANERPAARRLLAEAQLAAEDPDAALETLSVFTDSTDTAATLLRAHAYAGLDRWSEAFAIYQALNGRPGVPSAAAVGEAESLQALGRTGEAVAVLGRLVDAGQANPAARLRYAALLVEVDRGAEARAILKATPIGTPGDEQWKRYIEARLLLGERNPRAALAILEPMLAARSNQRPEGLSANLYAAATLALAEAYLTPDNTDPATKTLETFIRLNPDSPQLDLVFRRLDQLYARDKSPQEGAMQSFAKDLPPRVAALARFYITRMQIRAGSYKAALSIPQFLSNHPEHPLVPYVHAMRAELALATITPASDKPSVTAALDAAEAAFDAASLAAKTDELKAEFALRTALVNLRQGEFLRAANHLKTAKESPRLRESAAYDSALAWLMQENHEFFEKEYAAFTAGFAPQNLAGQLRLEQGLVKARAGDADANRAITAFIKEFPAHPRRAEAELALAELAFLRGDGAEAVVHVQAANQAAPSPEMIGQAEYLAIFIEEAKQPRNDDRVISLARAFIAKRPKSPRLAEVRMKLGQVYFQREDYLNAQEQFETLAVEQPKSDYAENALFLAGQCGVKLFSAEAHDHALKLFGEVADRHGPLESYARLQQAILKSQLGAEDDAVKIYDNIITAATPAPAPAAPVTPAPIPVPPEVRYAALIGKGDNLATLAKKDPKQAPAALAAYESLLGILEAGPTWHNQAAYKKARLFQQLGRNDEALVVFNEILDKKSVPGAQRELFWLSRAGFEAAALLESQQEWKTAIGIYKKMGDIPGAREHMKALQLEHFIFD
jgi:outer membrane protein assembly factor BamD (BamD/ComL family)